MPLLLRPFILKSLGANLINALKEVFQEIALLGLYQGGFFEKAAFYGGTALRILHGLPRFSEDLDFTLLEKNSDFNLERYFDFIIDELETLGIKIEIAKKEKKDFASDIASAFLKNGTAIHTLKIEANNLENILNGVHSGKKLKIKFEVDVNPPLKFQTESKTLLLPKTFNVITMTLPNLYAGKMHAVLCRKWASRVKGRDWYDFEWYIRHQIPLDFTHLAERALQFNGEDITRNSFFEKLKERLSAADINQVKEDVLPFVRNTRELDIWSNDYFLKLADMIKFEEDCIE